MLPRAVRSSNVRFSKRPDRRRSAGAATSPGTRPTSRTALTSSEAGNNQTKAPRVCALTVTKAAKGHHDASNHLGGQTLKLVELGAALFVLRIKAAGPHHLTRARAQHRFDFRDAGAAETTPLGVTRQSKRHGATYPVGPSSTITPVAAHSLSNDTSSSRAEPVPAPFHTVSKSSPITLLHGVCVRCELQSFTKQLHR